MPNLKDSIKKNKKTIIILAIILFAGIFLRTYKFHDWLRFSKDQSRDARIISNAALRGDHLPYLGPNAGTTKFRLGPIYYYFSYASEKIFGVYPDKMAYPSVFFSILSIPLLYFFLKEFFNRKISLAMTALMSVSYFMIINSRFSSNPNLITFFALLYFYGLLKILNDPKGKYALFWSALAGIGIGVSIQLHTTLLITMPIMTICIFAYLFFKEKSIKSSAIWKSLLAVILFSLILNTSQIYSEIDSHGSNTKLFFKGFAKSSEKDSNLAKSVFLIASCQIQANTHIISSFQDDINCENVFRSPDPKTENQVLYYFGMAITILFSLIGYFLLWKRFRREKDAKKKNFLGLVILFNFLSFIILIPIANIIFVGYFINLFFIPLVLLGIFIEESQNKFGKIGVNIAILAVTLLIASSLVRDGFAADRYAKGLENNSKNSTLGEVELMRDYIFSSLNGYNHFYFSGHGNALTSRFFAPIEYFSKEAGIKIEGTSLDSSRDDRKIDKNAPIFYIEENSVGNNKLGQIREGHVIISSQKFSSQTILILKH
ncbi:MAG: glycosyltransferase family 39 protein [Parcubacteria group bacterium]|jgi:4-amino-4-deoxy-L-arabinose transferase-like glycosyltransferase